MVRQHALRVFAAGLLIVGLGTGCGGAGCSFLKPLPADPKPLGFPTDQVIEGGIQARITKPGVDKLADALCNDSPSTCTLDVYSQHFKNGSATPIDITLLIRLDVDPTTGEMTIHLDDLNINNLGIDSDGCGFVGSFLSTVLSFVNSG